MKIELATYTLDQLSALIDELQFRIRNPAITYEQYRDDLANLRNATSTKILLLSRLVSLSCREEDSISEVNVHFSTEGVHEEAPVPEAPAAEAPKAEVPASPKKKKVAKKKPAAKAKVLKNKK